MKYVTIDDLTLEWKSVGAGPPVVTVHGALIADTFHPLFAERELTDRYRVIAFRRRGYGESTRIGRTTSISQQADDCRRLMQAVGIERAHIVGHSYGGVIAIQLALESPEIVRSLALLEPALMVGGSADEYRESLERGRMLYRESDTASLVEEFLQIRFGEDPRELIDGVLPGAFEQAVTDAGTFFEVELPALMDWSFTREHAASIRQPALVVLGEDSIRLSPRFKETYDGLLDWLPNAEGFILPDAAHGMQMQNPTGLATALASFFNRHPIRDSDAGAD